MKTQLFTNLKLLKKAYVCEDGLNTLIASLPKNHKDTTLINLLHILKSNGIDHFFWTWKATTKKEKQVKRMILHDILLAIEHLHPDLKVFKQVLTALKTGRKLKEATDAAYYAVRAAYSVDRATYYEATDADRADAAYYAARAAAYATADYADRATYYAVRAAYDAAAKKKQIGIIKKWLR